MATFFTNPTLQKTTKLSGNLSKTTTEKASGTLRASQAVPHPSTDRALRSLTSEFGWDRVLSAQYGRRQKLCHVANMHLPLLLSLILKFASAFPHLRLILTERCTTFFHFGLLPVTFQHHLLLQRT